MHYVYELISAWIMSQCNESKAIVQNDSSKEKLF